MIPGDPGDVWSWTNDPTVVAANEGYRFRGNTLNRRRYGGLWALLALLTRIL